MNIRTGNNKNDKIAAGVVLAGFLLTISTAFAATYTTADVASHDTQSNCWLIISGKVYNMNVFMDQHPGGQSAILNYCGQDATNAFVTKGGRGGHSSFAYSLLPNYYLGDIVAATPAPPVPTPIPTPAVAPTPNPTPTSGTQALIQQLTQQIASLKAQIAMLANGNAGQSGNISGTKHAFQLSKKLYPGMRGDDVRRLQQILATDPNVLSDANVTGYYGPLTEQAVKHFQKHFGLSPVGEVGPQTLGKLNALLQANDVSEQDLSDGTDGDVGDIGDESDGVGGGAAHRQNSSAANEHEGVRGGDD